MEEGNGLQFMRARFSARELGKFLQKVPIGLEGFLNYWAYVANNPLSSFLGVVAPGQFYTGLGQYIFGATSVISGVWGTVTSAGKASRLTFPAITMGAYGCGAGLRNIWNSILGIPGPVPGGFLGALGTSYAIETGIDEFRILGDIEDLFAMWFLGTPKPTNTINTIKFSNRFGKSLVSVYKAFGELANKLKIATKSSEVIRPNDPNEKTATAGVGDQHYIARGDEITYQVYFENKSTATAPAQEVFIDDTLDSNLDWSTFKLDEIAFGSQVVTSLSGKQSGTDQVQAGNMLLNVITTYSPASGKIRWTLRTIDPETGELPQDAYAGFLPPEDGTGRGQGHVTFKVRARNDRAGGMQIKNKAAIVFDTETPLSTNEVFNTIADDAPSAPAGPSVADQASGVPPSVVLAWAASQYATSYDIYLWKSSQSKPAIPTATGLASPFYDPPGDLDYATTYYWQAIARNAMGATPGPVWSFTTASLQFPVIVNKQGSGAGTVTSAETTPLINCGSVCSKSYDADTRVVLTAVPNTGSSLAGWTGCDTVNNNQCEVILTATKAVSAIFNDTIPPGPPVVTGPSLTSDTRPTWTWTSGGGDGIGTYRYQLASEIGEWIEAKATAYTPASALAVGTYTLYVQEWDDAGNWSMSGSKTITIDSSPPDTVITSKPASLSNSKDATFGFSSSEPNSTFQCQLDAGAYEACASPKAYVGIADGSHTFNVKATDSALNTDATPASYTWTIDTVAPGAPVVSGITPTENPRPTWTWTNGGGDGNRTYRYKLDSNNLSTGATETMATTYTPTSDLLVGTHTLYVQERDAAENWSASGSKAITIASPNLVPVAQAGPDQNVLAGSAVSLDGSSSFDPEGDLITFAWSFTEVPPDSLVTEASLSDKTSAKPLFTPDVDGVFKLQLIVNDGKSDSAPDEVIITAATPNVGPNANAGPDQNVSTGGPVYLDGSGSIDPDGWPSALTYMWDFFSLPEESTLSNIDIDDNNKAQASFIPDVDGIYVVRLSVSDGELGSNAVVNIVSSTLNVPPNANAGADLTIYLGETASLDGSASSDPDNGPSPLGYAWQFVSVPAGSLLGNQDITEAGSAFPTFIPDRAGTYVVELMVSDGAAATYDNVAVTVKKKNKEKTYVISGGAYNYPETATYKATFSLEVRGPASPSGHLNYHYARTGMHFVSTGITSVSVSGNIASIQGTGTVNNAGGYPFTATVTDGSPDKFGITIKKPDNSLYYSAGPGNTSGGNLKIRLQ